MSALSTDRHDDDWQSYDDAEGEAELPRRPRRRLFTRWSAALVALLVGAIGFYAGVRVEKGQLPASSGSGLAGALASRLAAAGGARPGAGPGFAGAFGAGGSTIGTVSSVDGNTIYVTSTSGNTVKVKLSSATTITKSQTVGRGKLYPGDSVVVQGTASRAGAVSATSVSDSGSRASGTGTGTGGATASGSASGSASPSISSLFGG